MTTQSPRSRFFTSSPTPVTSATSASPSLPPTNTSPRTPGKGRRLRLRGIDPFDHVHVCWVDRRQDEAHIDRLRGWGRRSRDGEGSHGGHGRCHATCRRCFPRRMWMVGRYAREMVGGPLDGLLMSVPRVGCNTGHLRVGLGTTHLAESLGDWARLVCAWLLLDGLLPGRPVGTACCLRKRTRVRHTSFCYLCCESRLCAVGVYEWCRCTVFQRCDP